jgi:DNA-binding Xre family transcriptional regulator
MSRPNDKRNKDIVLTRRKHIGKKGINKKLAEKHGISEAAVSKIYYRDKDRF